MSFRNLLARLMAPSTTKVDVDTECDYPLEITAEDYQFMHDRDGVGARVNSIMPEACWEQDPEIFEVEDPEVITPFEESFNVLEKKLGILSVMEQADIDSGIGCYGIMLLGFDDGADLEKPLAGFEKGLPVKPVKESELLYIRSFSQRYAELGPRLDDKTSPRHGMPENYMLTAEDGSPAIGRVHWSRVVHISERPGREIFHSPRMEKVYNKLLDLRKNYGGSAQSTWQGGFPGISLEPSQIGEGIEYEIDPEQVRDSMQKYILGLQRYIAIEGLSAKSLATQIYDPTPAIEAQLKAIALILGIPYRIFLGTEEAQLAGSQDQKNFNRRVMKRQNKVCTNRIVRPTCDHLVLAGALAPVSQEDDYTVKWPDRDAQSREQRVDSAVKETEALAKYVQGGVAEFVPESEFLTMFLGRSVEEAEQILDAAKKRVAELGLYDDEEDPTQDPNAQDSNLTK